PKGPPLLDWNPLVGRSLECNRRDRSVWQWPGPWGLPNSNREVEPDPPGEPGQSRLDFGWPRLRPSAGLGWRYRKHLDRSPVSVPFREICSGLFSNKTGAVFHPARIDSLPLQLYLDFH